MISKVYLPSIQFRLRAGRILLTAYAAFILLLGISGIVLSPAYASSHPQEYLPNTSWTLEQLQAGLRQLGWPLATPVYISLARSFITLLISSAFGLLLLWRRPPGLFTLFLAFTFISFGAGGPEYEPVINAVPALQPLIRFYGAATWQWFFIVLFFFPSGQAVPRWTLWPALAWLAFIIIAPFITSFSDQSVYARYAWVFVVLVLGAILSQVYRYFWRSDAVQRQQTKWILFLVLLYAIIVGAVAPFAFHPPAGDDLRFQLIFAFANYIIFSLMFLLFPVAVFVAILRYRLWDIDLVIRRTLVYAILTALLGLVYFGLVTLAQALFVGANQEQSPLVLVISTLAIAAMVNPLRRRIQELIDRRFFRRRYDAATALDRFSQNLRSQVELPAIQQELAEVVSETIQPVSLSLWIRKVEKL